MSAIVIETDDKAEYYYPDLGQVEGVLEVAMLLLSWHRLWFVSCCDRHRNYVRGMANSSIIFQFGFSLPVPSLLVLLGSVAFLVPIPHPLLWAVCLTRPTFGPSRRPCCLRWLPVTALL